MLQDFSENRYDAVLNDFTINQLTASNKEYRVIPTNPLRDNTIHHTFLGDTINAISEQVNLLNGTTAPTDTYIFEGALPSGLSLSAFGALTGTATQIGIYDLLIRLVDANPLP